MGFILATDTSCDVFRNELTAREIVYKPLSYIIDDVAYPDEFTSDAEYKEFYDKIRGGKMPSTSQINLVEHEEFFDELINKYDGDVVYLTLSSGLSGSYATACAAAKNVKEKTDRNIYVVDSLGATISEAQLRDFVNHIHTWFVPVDLMHLKRGGRVSGPMAYLGTALNIKPVLFINKIGGLSVVHKIRGTSKAMAFMAERFASDGVKYARKFYVASADSEFADEMLARMKAVRPDCEGEVGWIGPVIGAHTGCGAVGITFLPDKTSQNLI